MTMTIITTYKKLTEKYKRGLVENIPSGKYIYSFHNLNNDKYYIGETTDINDRMESYVDRKPGNNYNLQQDFINDDFNITIEKLDDDVDLKSQEEKYIKEYSKSFEMYNMKSNPVYKKEKVSIELGGMTFRTKKSIKDHIKLLREKNGSGVIENDDDKIFYYELSKIRRDLPSIEEVTITLKEDNWGTLIPYLTYGNIIEEDISLNKCIDKQFNKQ